ncbi:Type II secretion system protein F [Pirellulimonas nuda]|uniref:Type II secretion system protein F n=1 Tax=Pirellulimonas nuda TaxID=2528009 RepID=A0A518DI00_9BACT|nr:type II secretion system F family protein [Pirellulimonas nuda]QDU91107.1 Type II secretion system protein F [Pirellulimonas nuda]
MRPPPTLDDLHALNAELLALTRAGLPIEAALCGASGRGAELADVLGQRMTAGASLAEAVRSQGDRLPATYGAVVEAGVRSGRLPAALEDYARALARAIHLRHVVALAMVYPLILVVLAWQLLVFAGKKLIPAYGWIDPDRRYPLEFFRWEAGDGLVATLVVVLPLLVMLGAWFCWQRSGAASRTLSAKAGWLRWVPGVGRVIRLTAAANLADLLALLVTHRTPLAESLRLASDASGWPAYLAPCAQIADAIGRGEAVRDQSEALAALPSAVSMALRTPPESNLLPRMLRGAAQQYESRAAAAAEGLSVTLPMAATVAIGGTVTLAYALLMLTPYIFSLQEIAAWH